MFKFLKNFQEMRKIRLKIEKQKAKAELYKAKALISNHKHKQKLGKYEKLISDIQGQKELAGELTEIYKEGGYMKLLENPMIQQLITGIISNMNVKKQSQDTTLSSFSTSNPKKEGVAISQREQKANKILALVDSMPSQYKKMIEHKIGMKL